MNKCLICEYQKKINKIFKKLRTQDFKISKKDLIEKVIKIFLDKNEKKLINLFLKDKKKTYEFEKYLKKKLDKNEFILYGAGGGAHLFFNFFCKKYNLFPKFILDKQKRDNLQIFDKIPIYLFQEFKEKIDRSWLIVLTVSNLQYQKEIMLTLKERGIRNIIILPQKFWGLLLYKNMLNFEIFWKNYINFPDYYFKNKYKILKVIEILSDKKSIEVYYKCVKSFLLLKEEKIPFDSREDQYFPKDIKFNKGYNVFIDCGAYVGDTVRQLNKYYGKINTLICFEPNIESYNKLQIYLKQNSYNIANTILALPCAVYSKEKFFRFKNAGAGSSIVNSEKEGEEIVFSVVLDRILCNFKPTFIKMDIEGAEFEALKGAKNIIKNHKPDLAISLYHHPAHFWEIPLYLNSLEVGYKFYIRKYFSRFVNDTVLYATSELN